MNTGGPAQGIACNPSGKNGVEDGEEVVGDGDLMLDRPKAVDDGIRVTINCSFCSSFPLSFPLNGLISSVQADPR